MKISGIISLFLALFWGSDCLALQRIEPARSWGYQLQQANPAQLAACPYDVLVMDYSFDGTDATAFTAAQIKAIRDQGKTVLAYLSIGEAENYRFYWQPAWTPGNPSWLGPENPEWPGNHKVKYWDPGWWSAALQPFLDRILAAGFNGVYLDIIDAYWYWHETGGYELTFTADKMVALVEQIGAYTRTGHPDFLLCPQNAEAIIDAPVTGLRDRYFQVINAIGVESLFYNVFSPEDQAYRLQMLRQYGQAGKNIFNIEYIDRTQWQPYLAQVCAAGLPIIPYAGAPDALLDELIPDFPRKNCDRGKSAVFLLLMD